MAPATGTALLILAAFVLPGFVAVTVKERTHVAPTSPAAFDRLLVSVYYSALVYLVPAVVVALGGWTTEQLRAFALGDHGLTGPIAVAIGVVLVLPVVVAMLSRWWGGSRARAHVFKILHVSAVHATESSWDFMFQHAEQSIVRARLRDGTLISGYYGPSSHSGFGTRPDLFLEQLWTADDAETTLSAADSSVGVWLAADEVVSVELYAYTDAQKARIAAERAARHQRPAGPGGPSADRP